MDYDVNALSTPQECDELLEQVQKEKKALEVRKQVLELRQDNSEEASSNVETEITAAQAELAAFNTLIPTLPEGDAKKVIEKRVKYLEYRLLALEARQENVGVVATLVKLIDEGRVEGELGEITKFIAAVEERKAVLAA